jgi:D-cysteine desulfhydrase family pyridoxal phosphate-dependent enzyme
MDRLSEAWGGPTVWVKRDDLTGFVTSGNKIRKLEYHLAAALRSGAGTVITCGSAQSNHSRATAAACAPLGLHCVVFLYTADGRPPPRSEGNHLVMEMLGAEIRYLTPEEYGRRDEIMEAAGSEVRGSGSAAWVIPEGASDALGMWGFVTAVEELAGQLEVEPAAVWHAASSGGTTAGMAWGAARIGTPIPVVGCCIGETAAEVQRRIGEIWDEAADVTGETPPEHPPLLIDRHVGLGYGRSTPGELEVQAEATRLTGMLLDPTYTGKAMVGLEREIRSGRYGPGDHVVFWHTGGGFAAFAAPRG